MKEIISAIISKLSDDYQDASGKTKILLVVSVAAALAVVGGVSIRSCRSSSTSSRQRHGISSLSVTGENGDKWILDLAKGQALSVLKSNSPKPGPPLLIKTDVQTKGREVSIGLIVEGQAGEKYAGGVKKNERWQPPPRFKVVDKAGKVLASGVFKYG